MADFAYADPPYIGCADRHYRGEDSLHDLFPGSGAMVRAWQTYQRGRTVSNGYRRPPDPAQEVMFV